MAVLNKEDFLKRLQEHIGDDTSDEAMTFIEDMTDTFNDMETKSSGQGEEQWQKKYEELDKSWRQKYKDRFFNSETTPNDVKNDQEDDVKDDAEEKTYADLFVEREG
jgi:hypothetical protein